jgi:hypothetical protein
MVYKKNYHSFVFFIMWVTVASADWVVISIELSHLWKMLFTFAVIEEIGSNFGLGLI